jgi:hypothetical protein
MLLLLQFKGSRGHQNYLYRTNINSWSSKSITKLTSDADLPVKFPETNARDASLSK